MFVVLGRQGVESIVDLYSYGGCPFGCADASFVGAVCAPAG